MADGAIDDTEAQFAKGMERAKTAYTIYRGALRKDYDQFPHWDDLPEPQRIALAAVATLVKEMP